MNTSSTEVARESARELVRCAFCHGAGTDPYGVLSERSICGSCGGRGTVMVPTARKTCIYCQGTGSYKTFRCPVCEGAGVIPLPTEPYKRCLSCNGLAVEQSSGLACLTCRGHGTIPA